MFVRKALERGPGKQSDNGGWKLQEKDDGVFWLPTVDVSSPSTFSSSYPGCSLVKKSAFRQHRPKPTICKLIGLTVQTPCSVILKRSIRSHGVNLLLTDPAVAELLLLCVSCQNNRKPLGLPRLPRSCPFDQKEIVSLVDYMPPLTGVLRDATSTTTSGLEKSTVPLDDFLMNVKFARKLDPEQKKLLQYLLTSACAHLTSSPLQHQHKLDFPSFKKMNGRPSSPHAFLVTRQPPHKEAFFRALSSREYHKIIPVFHGTHPSRLPMILTQGLRNMSYTRYQAHGRCLGRGIYLASDSATSVRYAQRVTPGYSSRFREQITIKILLGCELIVPVSKQDQGVHVERDEGKVVVRIIWVLPGDTWSLDPNFDNEAAQAMRTLRTMRGD